jgi:hypothetical protein
MLVKIFARVSTPMEEQLIISQWGPPDHRSSVIHPAFVSFERLVEGGEFEVGFLDNRKVALHGSEIIQFKSGGIEVLPAAPEIYRTAAAEDFFLTMHRIYRSQLRSMCQLRRNS